MIRLDRVTKSFGGPNGVVAVDHVSFEVPRGKICVLLGPSGCGKTTTLKMVNRLIEPSAGAIYIDGRDTAGRDPTELRRGIGYVIQQIGLFPNKSVADNVCTVPDLLGWDRRKSRARAAELLDLVGLDPAVFLNRYPKELSGGQQQRVGVVRAIAADPPVVLMDEPFGAIDPVNRAAIQDEFLKMQAALQKTILFVSHDIDEAVKMGDLVAIFREGRLVQFDTPDRLLARPADGFVADFVGADRTLKRLRLVKVGEAMAADPPRVRAADTLGEAAALLERHGHAAIVMVGPKGRARGCITREAARAGAGTVGEHHAPLPATVRVDDDLRTAVSQMFAHGVDWLACVDGDGAYRGFLTQRGITQLLAETGRDG